MILRLDQSAAHRFKVGCCALEMSGGLNELENYFGQCKLLT